MLELIEHYCVNPKVAPPTHVRAAVIRAAVVGPVHLALTPATLPRPTVLGVVSVYRSEGVPGPVCLVGVADEGGGGVRGDSMVTPVVERLHGDGGDLGGVVEVLLGGGVHPLPYHIRHVWPQRLHWKTQGRKGYSTTA